MAYIKTILRLFKNQLARLITLALIIMVSIGFVSGIGEVKTKINDSFEKYYKSQCVMDINVKSQNLTGFSLEELNFFKETYGEENVDFCFFNFDSPSSSSLNGKTYRIYNNFGKKTNKLQLVKGKMPKVKNEVVVERKTDGLSTFKLGEQIEYLDSTYTVVGQVLNPLIIQSVEEMSFSNENQRIDGVIYFFNDLMPMPINDVYISLEDKTLFNDFSSKYNREIARQKNIINDNVNGAIVLTLNENFGIKSLSEYANKVADISIVFIVFFMLITCLVVFSTMTRLLDEERGQIATLKTLGYSNKKILLKYLMFVLVACLVGGIIALGVGQALTYAIYSSFKIQYSMPPLVHSVKVFYYALSLALVVVSALMVTLFMGLNMLRSQPARLLTPKSPKSGKKIFLERVGGVWQKLSFKYKSSIRNVFLFKSRFFMTLLSIMASTILTLAGFSLLDNTMVVTSVDSVKVIAIMVIVFACALGALVVYNLTNINVSERKREIATLMVLGYTDSEVEGYMFREVYIIAFMGIIIGLPIGYFFLDYIFNFINFGCVENTNWWSWIVAPLLIVLFVFISTLLLKSKIIKTDMNASLKSVE